MLYQVHSGHARAAEDYARDFERMTSRKLEMLDWDSPQGIGFAEARDIVIAPTIVIVDDNGSVLHQWLGDQFPLFNDVVAYMATA